MKKEVNQAEQSFSEGGCPAGSSVCRNPVHYSGGGGSPSSNPTCHPNSPWPAECNDYKPKDEELEPPQ